MKKLGHKIRYHKFATKIQMNEAIRKISKIRRDNLKLLREEAERVYLSEFPNTKYTNEMFSEYVGLKLAVYYQLLIEKTKPKFSEHYARKIEVEANLPMLWMDKKRKDVEFNDIKLESVKVAHAIKVLLEFVQNPDFEIKSNQAEDKLVNKIIEHMYSNETITKKNLISFLVED